MTRETKVGLLIGMGVILLIGIIVSDTLSVARQGPADLVEHGDRSQDSIFQTGTDEALVEQNVTGQRPATRQARHEPLPASEDAETRRRRALARQDAPQRQLPTALAVDVRSSQSARPPAGGTPGTASDVPSINLSHDWMFHTPEPVEEDVQPAEPMPARAAVQPVAQRESQPQPRLIERTTATSPTGRTHTIQSGETLYDIAAHYYGSGEQWHRLAEVNSDVVGPKGRVAAGTKLVIPDRDTLTLLEAGFERVGAERVVQINNPTAATSTTSHTITVGSGDTLSGLAAKHLGSAGRWRDLLEANRDQLDSDTALRAGMTLKLPGGAVASRGSGRSTGSARAITVQSGDSLTRIAQRELGDGERWRDIYEANRDTLASPDSLRVGQTLRLP